MELPVAESRILLFIGIALLVGGYALATYRGLAAQRQRVAGAWSRLLALLQRREELVGALLDGTPTSVRPALERARQAALAAGADAGARAAAERELVRAARQLLASAEATPEPPSSSRLPLLRAELAAIERELALAWRRYDDAAREYATTLETFPASVLARWFGFRPAPRFALERVIEPADSAAGAAVAPQ